MVAYVSLEFRTFQAWNTLLDRLVAAPSHGMGWRCRVLDTGHRMKDSGEATNVAFPRSPAAVVNASRGTVRGPALHLEWSHPCILLSIVAAVLLSFSSGVDAKDSIATSVVKIHVTSRQPDFSGRGASRARRVFRLGRHYRR